jgi:DNA-binding transcriptional ArsR family regulator
MNVRNLHRGLLTRTKILVMLEKQGFTASNIVKGTGLSYSVVTHHLRLLKNEGTVERMGIKRYVWCATGLGQKRLN